MGSTKQSKILPPFWILILGLPIFSWAWPWVEEPGKLGLKISYNTFSADEKFSDGSLAGTSKGDIYSIFKEEDGEVKSNTIDLNLNYVVIQNLEISLYNQWANILWDKTTNNDIDASGFGDTYITLKYQIPISIIPVSVLLGGRLPTGSSKLDAQQISLGERAFAIYPGLSTGWKISSWFTTYSLQEFGYPFPKINTPSFIQKGMYWKGNLSGIFHKGLFGLTTSLEWFNSKDWKIKQGGTRSSPGEAYINGRVGFQFKWAQFKFLQSIIIPFDGVEYPTANRFQFGISSQINLFS